MASITPVSFVSPGTDYAADQAEILRRQKMAEMLQAQSQEPLQTNRMAGRFVVPISPLEGLAKAGKGMAASYMEKKNEEKQRELAKRMQEDAMGWYGQQPVARPQTMPGFGGEPEQPTGLTQQPTQQERMAWLMRGGMNPMTAPMAQMMMAQAMQPPQRVDMGDKIGLLNPQGQIIGTIPKGPTPDAQLKETGAQRRHETPSGSAQLGSNTTLATSVLNPDVMRAKQNIAQAGATQVQMKVNAFTPASEEAQRDFMKSTRATFDQLKQAPVLLDSLEKAKALIPSAKGFMGPGGESLLEAAKFLNNRLGTNINTEGVKGAEELRTRIFFNIMDNLKKLDAQPSQMQQQIMMESLGKLGTDPNALPRVLDAFGDVIRGKVQLHNQEVEGAVSKGVKFPYDPSIKIPTIPEFATEAEAAAAGLKPGTRIKIGGKSGVWK